MKIKYAPLAATLATLTFASQTLANSVGSAENLSRGLLQAKSRIDSMIGSAGGGAPGDSHIPSEIPNNPSGGGWGTPSGGGWGTQSGGGHSPWFVGIDLVEADALALPIFVESSSSLGAAASLSDQAKLAFLNGNPQMGNYRFSQACAKMGISRSQIARANTAALQPPVGFLAAFGQDLRDLVVELNALKVSEGCP